MSQIVFKLWPMFNFFLTEKQINNRITDRQTMKHDKNSMLLRSDKKGVQFGEDESNTFQVMNIVFISTHRYFDRFFTFYYFV